MQNSRSCACIDDDYSHIRIDMYDLYNEMQQKIKELNVSI